MKTVTNKIRRGNLTLLASCRDEFFEIKMVTRAIGEMVTRAMGDMLSANVRNEIEGG